MPKTPLRSFEITWNGLSYNVYGDPEDRDFALYHAPIAIQIYKPAPGRYKVTVEPLFGGITNHYIFQQYV